MWQMIFDIIRFNQFALDLLAEKEESELDPTQIKGSGVKAHKPQQQQSIGEYLDQNEYSEAFRHDYLIPMTASVWSTAPDKASLEFPAITLVRFLWNHHLLTTIAARPTWMTILGGTKQYIDIVMKDFPPNQVHLRTAIKTLRNQDDGRVLLMREDGNEDLYDHVILATHGDQATEIIRDTATPEETSIMSAFKTSTNYAALHSDLSVGSLAFAILLPSKV